MILEAQFFFGNVELFNIEYQLLLKAVFVIFHPVELLQRVEDACFDFFNTRLLVGRDAVEKVLNGIDFFFKKATQALAFLQAESVKTADCIFYNFYNNIFLVVVDLTGV